MPVLAIGPCSFFFLKALFNFQFSKRRLICAYQQPKFIMRQANSMWFPYQGMLQPYKDMVLALLLFKMGNDIIIILVPSFKLY